jgi:hypothetical protein
MNCRRVQRLLFDYQDGRLSGQLADSIAAHLRDCHTCRRLRNAAATAEGKLRVMADGQPPSHRSLRHEALRRWSAERQAAPRPDRSRLRARASLGPTAWSRPVGVATGVVLVGIAALLLARWGHNPSNLAAIPLAGDSPATARASGPPQTAPGLQVTQHPAQDAGQQMVRSAPASPGTKHNGFPSSIDASRPAPDRQPASAGFTNRQAPRLRGDEGAPNEVAHASKTAMRPWAPLAGDAYEKIEAVVRRHVPVRDDFVRIPFPRIAATSDREIAEAVESYQREAAIVDARLSREVTVLQKATPLSDLCERLRTDTGIQLGAGASVADEKVTLFCEKMPLREVMRELSRPFGYTWLRSGKAGEYRYELVQDLRSQLLEEELRNRDRNQALLALEKEMDRYRPYLSLSPDEALARSKTAPPAEKLLLDRLATEDWGPIQMYFRLPPSDLAALRAGRSLEFKQAPGPGQRTLPPDVARGTLQSQRARRLRDDPDNPDWPRFGNAETLPDGVPPASYPRARALVQLHLGQSELGQYTIQGSSAVEAGTSKANGGGELASGMSPAVRNPENAQLNSRWSQDPALRARVSLNPEPSCLGDLSPSPSPKRGGEHSAKVTSADVLEALHHASRLPLVADFYTRLSPAAQVSLRNATLFDALNRLSDTLRLRWSREKASGNWLQFRSVSFYDDRLKEVPHRLLARWSDSRRRHGGLPLDDLVEIAQLPNVQLNSDTMAEGARDCFDLQEWDLVRWWDARFHLRYLASLTSDQRRTAMSAAGLPFRQLALAQQPEFLSYLTRVAGERLPSLEAVSQMTIRVEYLQPGEFQWVQPGMSDYLGDNRPWPVNYFQLPTARGRTRDAVLQAARRVDPNVDPAQIRPTELWLAVIFRSVDPQTGKVREWGFSGKAENGRGSGTWPSE